MEYEHDHSPSSFRRKLKTSIFCAASSCSDCHDHDGYSRVLEPSSDANKAAATTFSTWLKSETAEIKGLFSGKIGRNRRRGNSAEFRYDPLSYALNFDDDDSRIDQFPLRDFSARLPPSPPPQKATIGVSRQIAAFS